MRPDDVLKWIKAQPFQPFVLELTTGQRLEVRHPELLFVGRSACHLVRLKDGLYDDFADIALVHIVKIESVNGAQRRDDRPSSETN